MYFLLCIYLNININLLLIINIYNNLYVNDFFFLKKKGYTNTEKYKKSIKT